jgi:hypothetical protein
MNFDSEPSAVSSGEDEGVTGSENEPAWKRYSLICLISISYAIVRDVPCREMFGDHLVVSARCLHLRRAASRTVMISSVE